MAIIRIRWRRNHKYYDQSKWRTACGHDVVFSNQASHHLDLHQWIMGDVESVLAKSTTSLVDIEAEDTGIAKTATKKKYPEEPTSIIGEQATVKIGEFALN